MHKSPRDRAFTLRWRHPKAALLPGKSTQRREHPNLTCRPPAQKTQILRSDRQPEEQVCHLRVHPGMKRVKGYADGHPSIPVTQRRAVRQSGTIIKLFWSKYTCLLTRCEWTSSFMTRARPPQPSHTLASSKWCHLPSTACRDYCFVTVVQEQRGFVSEILANSTSLFLVSTSVYSGAKFSLSKTK